MLSFIGYGQLIRVMEYSSGFTAQISVISQSSDKKYLDEVILNCSVDRDVVQSEIAILEKLLRLQPNRKIFVSFSADYAGFNESFIEHTEDQNSQVILLQGCLVKIFGWKIDEYFKTENKSPLLENTVH